MKDVLKTILKLTYCYKFFGLLLTAGILQSCYPEEKLNVEVSEEQELINELDVYIQENFTDEFNVVVRYKFVDNFVEPTQRVSPPKIESVRPMLDFIEEFWIGPYLEVENGEAFFRRYVPSELVFLGGSIYNTDGTRTLGIADAGARITFTNVNDIDVDDEEWMDLQLQVTFHEFAHIVHQEFALPTGFETISPEGYTSAGSWFVLEDQEALERGFVSPYGTLNPNEDFAEVIAFFLFDDEFYEKFIDQEENCITAECEAANEGKTKISEKLVLIMDHYQKSTGLNLEEVRNAVLSRL